MAIRSGETTVPAGSGESGGHLAASILCRSLPQASSAAPMAVLPGMLSAPAYLCSREADGCRHLRLLLLSICCRLAASWCPLPVVQRQRPCILQLMSGAASPGVSQGQLHTNNSGFLAPQLRLSVLPTLTALLCCICRLYVSGAILGYKR